MSKQLDTILGSARSAWPALALLGLLGCEDSSPAGVKVVSATDLGVLEQAASISGRDGGYSARFDDYTMWFYGDSILSFAGEDGSSWRNNTCSWSLDLDSQDGVTGFFEDEDSLGAPRECLPRTEAEQLFNRAHDVNNPDCEEPCGARYALWPEAMVVDPGTGRGYVFYNKIYGEPGEWNFHTVGSSIAVLDGPLETPVRPEVGVLPDDPTLLFGPDEPLMGPAALIFDGYVYVYGCAGDFGDQCKVGRVPVASIMSREAWRFYRSGEWQDSSTNASTVLVSGSLMTVHWNEHIGAFLAVYNVPLENNIALRTAPRPEGPWSDPLRVFEAIPGANGANAYSALAHEELSREGGRVQFITYYRNTGDWSGEIRVVELVIDPKG
jgi:hypothetical protein